MSLSNEVVFGPVTEPVTRGDLFPEACRAYSDNGLVFSKLTSYFPKKRGTRLLLAISLVVLISLALYAAYPRIVATKVSTINTGAGSSPTSWNGRALHVFGSVVDRGDNEVTIADGTGSIKVAWFGGLPGIGASNVLVHGILKVEGAAPQPSLQLVADSLAVWPI